MRDSHIFFLFVLGMVMIGWSTMDDLSAPIKENTCRLANTYTVEGKPYSGSAGATINGEYPTAESDSACTEKCRRGIEGRLEGKPEMYGLIAVCPYGETPGPSES